MADGLTAGTGLGYHLNITAIAPVNPKFARGGNIETKTAGAAGGCGKWECARFFNQVFNCIVRRLFIHGV